MSGKIDIIIDPDLMDLTPVLTESLSKELEDIRKSISKEDFAEICEIAHSSRGAALTFGYDTYVRGLEEISSAAQNENTEDLKKICLRLENLLQNTRFIPEQS